MKRIILVGKIAELTARLKEDAKIYDGYTLEKYFHDVARFENFKKAMATETAKVKK